MFGRRQAETQPATQDVLSLMETIPVRTYWIAAIGSILISAILYLSGKRTAALFVGQWPPTFILFSLFYRLLRPSREDTAHGMEHTGRRARAMS